MPQNGAAHGSGSSAPTSSMVGWVGRIGAPALAIVVYLLLAGSVGDEPGQLSETGRRVAAVGVLMAVLWMTEALPLAATALLPLTLFPLLGIMPIGQVAEPYASPVIFLFMGGFMLALSMERWNLHRRIALLTLLVVGTKPRALVAGFMVASATLSMWISNTAAAVMMLPIALTVVTLARERLGSPTQSDVERRRVDNLAVCLLLGVAYATSIGGLGTLIGTPPNALLAGYLRETFDREIDFLAWMRFATPFAMLYLAIAWFVLTVVVYPTPRTPLPGGRAIFRDELRRLGGLSSGERATLAVFLCAAGLWVSRPLLLSSDAVVAAAPVLTYLTDEVIAIAAGLALFAIPTDARRGVFTLDWPTASRLPWDVLLLFGGGLTLAAAVSSTGLDRYLGDTVASVGDVPTWALVLIVVAVIVFLSEVASNTATAAAFLPILGGVAVGFGLDPLALCVPATMAATCAFMLPVGTPPNAIVFGTGHVRMGQMMRAGIVLNLVGIALITLASMSLAPWLLGYSLERGGGELAGNGVEASP